MTLTDRAASQKAIALTMQSFKAYGSDYPAWQVSFSGGKDSSALVTLLAAAIAEKEITPPDRIVVTYADTRQELPPLHDSAMQILRRCRELGMETRVVTADLDNRFWVYLLGRGVPPPNNSSLRWCTEKIKLNPMQAELKKIYSEIPGNAAYDDVKEALRGFNKKTDEVQRQRLNEMFGPQQVILSLNGVRMGESAMRDRRIVASCGKNSSECGQGWFQRDLSGGLCAKLSPILHWKVCQVWDWLMLDAPVYGFETELLAEVYGGDYAKEMNARTGCIGCPLASEDKALNALIKRPGFEYLAPLKQVRVWHHWARQFENRLQKHHEKLKNGQVSKAGNRRGPLTLEFRLEMLDAILGLQRQCNELAGAKKVDIINDVEEARIRELIALKTWPEKWHGTEPLGNEILSEVLPDGSVQTLLFDLLT